MTKEDMSTIKKLSLSGFKSTFKRRTLRGNGRNNNAAEENRAQQATTQQGYVCDNESSKTNGHYRDKNASVKDTFRSNPNDIIIQNENEGCVKPFENNTSLSAIRNHSDGAKTCDHANGNIVNHNAEMVTETSTEPGSAANGMNGVAAVKPREDVPVKPPSANSHVLVNASESTKNVNESIYVGPSPRGSTLSLPPQIGNCHSFQDVNGDRHNYVNDGVGGVNTVSRTAECTSSDLKTDGTSDHLHEPKLAYQQQHHFSNHGNGSTIINNVGDIGIDAQYNDGSVNVIPLPPRPHRRKDDQSSCRQRDTFESDFLESSETTASEDESQPPAIPPKPAKFFSSGHWNFDKSSTPRPKIEERKQEHELDVNHEVPPRPPARTKVRMGVDVNLPFYKHYLERMENSQQQPLVYEAVRLEASPGSGGLAGELSKLPRQPWYWGPMAQDEAEEKLTDASDGSFLVRDSSDERYLLTLSFKSNGRCLHTRIEHRNGMFSLNDSEGHASVIELIHSAVRESQKGVFGYMNDSTGIQNYPARLTQWVSRYSEVKSLQHLCRFVIRETYPRHHIRKLPLPKKINEYILENQY